MPPRLKPAFEIDSPELTAAFGAEPFAARKVSADELSPRERIRRTQLSIMGHRPKMFAKRIALVQALEEEGTLSRRLIELIRLRLTFYTQCRTCAAARNLPEDELSEGEVCSLEKPSEATDLTDAERSVMRFVDLYATNNVAIDDAVYDDLRQYFDEGELVEIGAWCAEFYGWGRLIATWRIWDDLPESFKLAEGELITAWGHDDALHANQEPAAAQ